MPTYDYVCDKCEHEWEEFQPMGSKPVKACPSCRARRARRLIGAGAGILFKGSGFYETDYRSDSYQKAAKAEKESSSKSSGDKTSGGKGSSDKSSPNKGPSKKAAKSE